MSGVIISLQGERTRADLYEDRVELVGTSGMSLLGKNGIKTLSLSQITSIQLTNATAVSSGWLHFSVPGDKEMLPNIYGAKRNQNAVVFSKKENETADEFRREAEQLKNTSTVNNIGVSTSTQSDADELMKFKQLLDAGAITQEEFDKKKAQLLSL